jgi:uncharacterized phiE125 gp8 family phage protein
MARPAQFSALAVSTPPSVEPVSIAEFKRAQRVNFDDDDEHIRSLLLAARQAAEAFCRRAFINTAYTHYTAGPIDGEIVLPVGGVSAVSSVSYRSSGSYVVASASTYFVALPAVLARIVFDTIPVADVRPDAFKVVFTSGFGAAATDVPAQVRQAILRHAAEAYNSTDRATAYDGAPLWQKELEAWVCPVAS